MSTWHALGLLCKNCGRALLVRRTTYGALQYQHYDASDIYCTATPHSRDHAEAMMRLAEKEER